MKNERGRDKDVRVSASVPELDFISSSVMDIPGNRRGSAFLSVETPIHSETGDYFIRIEAMSRGQSLLVHRLLEVKEVCH